MYGPAVRLFAEESSGSAAYGAVRTIRANEPQRQRGSAEVIPRGTLRFAIEIDPGRGSASHLSFVTRVPGNGDDNASERRLAQHC
jgi:hypothetical protein